MICDPLSARQWYKMRGLVNLIASLLIFAAMFFMFLMPFGIFFSACFAAIASYCMYKFVLRHRTIAIRCPHCNKLVETSTPWICGSCYWKNMHAKEYPFIHRCEHYDCGAEPKAYQCHHCGELLFLTEDKQIPGFSMSINPFEYPSAHDDHEDAVKKKKQEIELKELAIKEAALDAQLKNFNQSLEGPKRKSIEDLYKGLVKNDDDARKLRVKIDEEFKDDPTEREKRHGYLKDILRDLS